MHTVRPERVLPEEIGYWLKERQMFFFKKDFTVCISARFDLTLGRLAHCGMHRRSLIKPDKAHRQRIALLFSTDWKGAAQWISFSHPSVSLSLFCFDFLSFHCLPPLFTFFPGTSFALSLTHSSPVIWTPPLFSSDAVNHLFPSILSL